MDIKVLVSALVMVPLLMMVSLAVLSSFANNSRTPFELSVVNETLGAVTTYPDNLTTDYSVKPGTISYVVYNTSNGTVLATGYNITDDTKAGYEVADVGVYSQSISANIYVNATYTAYTGTDYEQYVNTYQGTISGYNLGSMLPFVLIAVAIITVILGAFGMSRVL